MTENLGVAALYLTLETEGMVAGVKKAELSIKGLGAEAQKQFDAGTQAQKRQAISLVQYGQNLGKTKEEIRALGAQMKIGGALGNELAASIRATAAAQQGLGTAVVGGAAGATKAFSGTSKSIRELQFATRGLPAQFTDIAVSLQSGQRPLNVLLQQGGQLKDMFGGVGPAFRAMGGYLLALINPFTLAAAAVGLLAVAWNQAQSQGAAFNKALILTGNIANTSSAALAAMAQELDASTSATAGSAASALAAVAATGKFTVDQIKLVATAAIEMHDATGKTIQQTVAEFTALGGDPVEAALKLNGAIGDGTKATHFLTEGALDTIRALKEQGRTAEATGVLIAAYASASIDRAHEIAESATTMGGALHKTKQLAAELWDTLANGFNSRQFAQEVEDFDKTLLRASNALEAFLRKRGTLSGQPAFVGPPPLPLPQADRLADNDAAQARLEAEKRFGAIVEQNRSKESAHLHEIAELWKVGIAAQKKYAEIKTQVDASNAKFAADNAPRTGGGRSGGAAAADPSDGLLSRIKQQIALNGAQAASEDRLSASERLHVQVKLDLGQITGKVTAARRAEIEAALQQLDVSGAAAVKTLAEAKATESLLRLTVQLDAAEQNRVQANADALASIGHGDDYISQMQRKLGIDREYAEQVKDLNLRAAANKDLDYAAELKALDDFHAKSIASEVVFQAELKAARADGVKGIGAALENYISHATNVAERTEEIFSSTFKGLEDVATDFFTRGKADWKGFLDSILSDITRFVIQQQLSKWLGLMLSALGGGGAQTYTGNGTGAFGYTGSGAFGLAKGGVFNSPSLSAYSGGVYNTPQPFRFAHGAGVFGEAGPEAIMPLSRGRDGKLGVKGGGGSTVVNLEVINNGKPATAEVSTQKMPDGSQLIRLLLNEVGNSIAGGSGAPYSAIKSRFALRDAV